METPDNNSPFDKNKNTSLEEPITLQPKKVSELFTENFFISSYQRGYRWTKNQVVDLLNNIDKFVPQECNGVRTWHRLQPLVVKEMDETSKTECGLEMDKTWYEVIDGQQLLITLYLIIHYVNEMWLPNRYKTLEPLIYCESYINIAQYLSELKVGEDSDTVEINNENIDYSHISSAYETIHNWASKLDDCSCYYDFITKFTRHTGMVWCKIALDNNNIDKNKL